MYKFKNSLIAFSSISLLMGAIALVTPRPTSGRAVIRSGSRNRSMSSIRRQFKSVTRLVRPCRCATSIILQDNQFIPTYFA